ncbi:hypothetical protein DY000_02012734 [Brassica cretica]|uniref:Hexosyltransferase n=1 Tax=Brassica cretica TaxID=69181 RepID=A0ABQ7CXU2_BRACR|nr:hypothetical protein DY000_02012734 [Brassica cretica]
MRIRSEETTTSLSSAFNGTQMFFVFDLLHLRLQRSSTLCMVHGCYHLLCSISRGVMVYDVDVIVCGVLQETAWLTTSFTPFKESVLQWRDFFKFQYPREGHEEQD